MSQSDKYRKRAVEFEQLKQFDKAITYYIRAVELAEKAGDEVDVALFNKIGDLSMRMGRVPEAVTYYERAVERYATAGLFTNAIALCNKILRNAPGRSSVYFTLGRICARKGLRGDASRNFLEYASRMRSEERTEEAMRALAEVAELMPELTEIRGLVDDYAERNGIVLTRRLTPRNGITVKTRTASHDLVFLDVGYELPEERHVPPPPSQVQREQEPVALSNDLSSLMIFDPLMSDDVADVEEGSSDDGTAEAGSEAAAVTVAAAEGLIPSGEYEDPGVTQLDGFTAIEHDIDPSEAIDTQPLEALTSNTQEIPTVAESGLVSNEEFLNTEAIAVEPLAVEPLAIEHVAELDEAIAAGEEAARLGEAIAPMFRANPHDFILPGELPPIIVPDHLVVAAAEAAIGRVSSVPDVETPATDIDAIAETPPAGVATSATDEVQARLAVLRELVDAAPDDWSTRHRYAELLVEYGERDAGIEELELVVANRVEAGDVRFAYDVASQIVAIAGDRIRFHQKRVELAVRLGDSALLRGTYLDLADALVRLGEDARAHAVYARVLEIDPHDERARSALGIAAPPPPVEQPDDEYVDLAHWLESEGEDSTRLRMREPVITGDEQADFDSLLRHFREGVARTLSDDDHDSHYDLGVAYKEMGLLDDAIAEFQKALRSRVHRLPAYEALGQCFVEQERYQVAATILARALHEPGLDDTQRVGVLYLLGYSSEALQRPDDARSYFQRVYATDNNFRDVAARLAALEQVAR